jgi:hypothetical protein
MEDVFYEVRSVESHDSNKKNDIFAQFNANLLLGHGVNQRNSDLIEPVVAWLFPGFITQQMLQTKAYY